MKSKKSLWISIGLLVGVSVLAYLPLIHKIGYINDDWYLMYDARVGGAEFFHKIFSIDRPMRGYLMQAVFSLFGLNPLPYHLGAFVFRLLSGVGCLWLCSQMWTKGRTWNLLVAVLFLIYPGFLSQINPIDYQSQIISLACSMFSIALTVKAIQSGHRVEKWIYTILSVSLAWIYLGLVEYFIGLEILRFSCVIVIFMRNNGINIYSRIRSAIYAFLPFVLGAGGFLIWRLFLFSAERKATDIGLQISSLFSSPLTILWWLNYLIQDVFKVVVSAWVLPLDYYVFSLRLRDVYLGFMIAGMAVIITVLAIRWLEKYEDVIEADDPRGEKEKLWMAVATIIAGLLPVIIVNRHVVLPDYSRYTLASSFGVVMLWVVFMKHIPLRKHLLVMTGLFVAISVFTHYGNSVKAATDTEMIRNFWWQVAWRAPQIKSGTTISATYPNVAIQEDYFIWGPANHVYYPATRDTDELQVDLAGIVLNEYTLSRIIAGRGEDSFYRRGDVLVVNEYDNVLVMTQAADDSCVRILNGSSPDLSLYDDQKAMLASPYSKLDTLVTDGGSPIPPVDIFGKEPVHTWCFYYQKADLARQQRDWDEVAALYEQAVADGFHPNDQIELMPFLQAYAHLGDKKMVRDLSTRINTEVFYGAQACRKFSVPEDAGSSLSLEMQDLVDELFCK